MERGDHSGGKVNENKTTEDSKSVNSSGRVKILMAAAAFIFLAAAAASLFILRQPAGRVVEIMQDDEVLYSIDLDAAADQVIEVHYPEGSRNTITIENRQIWVSDAECPDHTCMKMGKLRSESLPIVCLPNHLVIRFAE